MADEAICPGCWTTLAALCLIGRDDRYCEAFSTYDRTGDSAILDQVLAWAPPDLVEAAKSRAATLGAIRLPAPAPEGGDAA